VAWLAGHFVHGLLLLAVVGVAIYATFTVTRAAGQREHPVLPSTMEQVDWSSPQSSEFCLACHRPVGSAMAGLDVRHGHPQNVPLSEAQQQAMADLGTVAGPGETLICMSCHKLGDDSGPHMLADTLAEGRLCGHCHPGHYAKGTAHDLRLTAPEERNRLGETVSEGGPCSACHLSHRYARAFEPCAYDPDGRCTTCHDMHGCAADHARTKMDHPESRCLECHDPHDPTHGSFLKLPPGELCSVCHAGYSAGALAGMHPIGPMNDEVPPELIEAGASVGPDPYELTCLVCHSVHSGENESLLVMTARSDRLCLTCHAEKLMQETHEGVSPKHGQQPILDADQLAVVRSWGRRTGPDGQLLCVSCHMVHGSKSPMALLAFQPLYGETCGACHPHHDGVSGTSHDLRTNFPEEQNSAGMTAAKHGACSACHLAHGYARPTTPGPGDPSGQCTTCHQPGACAATKLAGDSAHPETACTACHNPHERRFGNYLAKPEFELCRDCHAEQMRLVGGPHDYAHDTRPWPAEAQAVGGTCLPCHVPHGQNAPHLFRFGDAETIANADQVCLACHAEAGWAAESEIAAVHPQNISPDQHRVPLALVPKDAAGNLRMGCATCHDPHGGPQPVHLARVAADQPTESLCLHCHEEKEYVRFTGHSADSLGRFGFDVDSCKPCHAMHAGTEDRHGQMLSTRFLREACESVADLAGSSVEACVPCLACHHANGPAPVRDVATHPERPMLEVQIPPDSPGYLPLFNSRGDEDPQGQIVCRTCHLSHGRLDLLKRAAAKEELTPDERSSIRTQLRPFVQPNICTECHGVEARLRFLFFHDPQRRGFQRHDPTEQRPANGSATLPAAPRP